jgi:hypothetical protein
MKQLLPLFLLLLPCLALAQYPTNGNQKITLGEQTTADGLVYRGVLADTGIITPSSDTSAYIILDTVNHRFYHYKRNTNVWSIAGGSDTSLIAYVNTYGTQTVNGAKTFTSTVTGARFDPTSSSSTGNGMFLPTTNTLAFSTTGLERIRITSGGNLGLGVTPSAWISTAKVLVIGSTQSGTIAALSGGSFSIENNSFTNSSGIGTYIANGFATRYFQSGTGNHVWNIAPSSTAGSTITFTQAMILNSSGNVGIGQATPTAVLHLKAGTATASTAPLKFTSGTLLDVPEMGAVEFSTGKLYFSPTSGVGNRKELGYADLSNVSGVLPVASGGTNATTLTANKVMVGNGTSGVLTPTELHWNNSQKRLGIGINNPSEELEVFGNARVIDTLRTRLTSYDLVHNNNLSGISDFVNLSQRVYGKESTALLFGDSAKNNAYLVMIVQSSPVGSLNIGTTGNGNLNLYTASTLRTRFTTNGEIWMGYDTNQGNYRLQVKDSVYIGGNVSASAYTTRSDFNLKDDIFDIKYGLNDILKLQPVEYTYKSNGSKQLGFIAQDIGTILPEVVSFEESMSVNYQAIIPILTKAIQEQQALIKALEQRIINLENK